MLICATESSRIIVDQKIDGRGNQVLRANNARVYLVSNVLLAHLRNKLGKRLASRFIERSDVEIIACPKKPLGGCN